MSKRVGGVTDRDAPTCFARIFIESEPVFMKKYHIEEIMTIQEASDLWEIPAKTLASTLRAFNGNPPRYPPGEVKRSMGTILVTMDGVRSLYGEPRNDPPALRSSETYHLNDFGTIKELSEMLGRNHATLRSLYSSREGFYKQKLTDGQFKRSGNKYIFPIPLALKIYKKNKKSDQK